MNRTPFVVVGYHRAGVVYPVSKWVFHSTHQNWTLAMDAIKE